jgi:hypothetical protein
MAFQIVKQGDKVFHVYGAGEDREMIQVDGPRSTGVSTKSEASPATGGTAASSGTEPEEAAGERVAAPGASAARIIAPAAPGGSELAAGASLPAVSSLAATADPAVAGAASAGDAAAAVPWNGSPMLGALIDPAADSRARSRREDSDSSS